MSPETKVERDDNHVYSVAGEKKPGATGLLRDAGLLRGLEYVDEAALWRGKVVHHACHLINKGTLDESTLDPEIKPYADAYRLFLSETGFEPHISEIMLYHGELDFCGQIDVVGIKPTMAGNPEWWLVDFKSAQHTRTISAWVGYQTALYQLLLMHTFPMMKNIKRFGLKLLGTGKYNLQPFTDPNDFSVAIATLNLSKGGRKNV